MTDAPARELARSLFDRPVAVEAGAGTGKTTTLVARVLTWCIGPGWARAEHLPDDLPGRVLQGVVAITFTEAAAAEMAGRIAEGFEALSRGEPVYGIPGAGLLGDPAEQARRARLLLAEVDRVSVSTIHAFCRRVLASAPFEAGLHPDFDVDASGEQIAEVVREVVEEHFVAACLPSSELRSSVLILGDHGFGPSDLEEALDALLEKNTPSAALSSDPFAPEVVADYLEQLQAAVRELREVLVPEVERSGLGGSVVPALLSGLAWIEETLDSYPPSDVDFEFFLEGLAEALTKDRAKRLKVWSIGRFNVGEGEAFADCSELIQDRSRAAWTLLAPLYSVAPGLLAALRSLLHPMLAEVETQLRSLGVLRFGDLLSEATELLGANPEVLGRIRGDIDQLLVDEFQDTNPIQCRLVGLLALEGSAEERPGLFVVGDPKQAIYGWRGADLQAYEDFLDRMAAQGGEQVSLVVNRRSRKVVLEEVDQVLGEVMRAEAGLQPAFESLTPAREDAGEDYGGPGAAVEYWVTACWDVEGESPATKTTAAESAAQEARQLACDLVRLQRSGQSLSRVGVLFRSGGDLEQYLRELRGLGVPYIVERDKSYYRRREVIDAISLLRCVLEPADQVATLALLRSPWVGVPDAALIPLWSGRLPELLLDLEGPDADSLHALRLLLDGVAEELSKRDDVPGLLELGAWQDSVFEALVHIAELRATWQDLPADRFVESLRCRFVVEASEAARYQGSYRMANLERFFKDVTTFLDEAGGRVQAVLRRLRSYLSDQKDAEEARPDAPLDDAVRIMTIHKSKGLDFDHVYLPQLHKQSGRGMPRGGPGSRSGGVLASGGWEYQLFGVFTLGWASVLTASDDVASRERVRLLYVAMTRARNRLVLMGNWFDLSAPPEDPTDVNSLLGLFHWRDGGSGADPVVMGELQGRGEWHQDQAGARWVFPALDSREVEPLDVRLKVPATVPAEAAEDARLLAAHQQRSSRRQARPLGGAASSESHRVAAAVRDADSEEAPSTRPAKGDGNLGAAIGTAVHRALEHIDLAGDPGAALAGQLEALPAVITTLVSAEEAARAEGEAASILRAFWAGELGALMRQLGPDIVARELDFVAPSSLIDGAEALVYLTGAIDLVYEDVQTGQLVAVDFKTDRVGDPAVLAERVATYSGQLRAYATALSEGLALEVSPRAELWFLRLDQVVVVS